MGVGNRVKCCCHLTICFLGEGGERGGRQCLNGFLVEPIPSSFTGREVTCLSNDFQQAKPYLANLVPHHTATISCYQHMFLEVQMSRAPCQGRLHSWAWFLPNIFSPITFWDAQLALLPWPATTNSVPSLEFSRQEPSTSLFIDIRSQNACQVLLRTPPCLSPPSAYRRALVSAAQQTISEGNTFESSGIILETPYLIWN